MHTHRTVKMNLVEFLKVFSVFCEWLLRQYAAADAKKITALVGLDISAASDTIDHDVLTSRLESQFGVVGAASGWLWSYLRGRQQFVRLGRHSSPMIQCDCGVYAGFSARPAAVHCLRVSCWRADRVVRRVIPPIRR